MAEVSVVPGGSDPFTRSSRLAKPFPAAAEPYSLSVSAGNICNVIMMKHFLNTHTHTHIVQWLLILVTSKHLVVSLPFKKNNPFFLF